ncbi:MAG: hypothetical protein ACLFPF_07190 [Halanaerobiales bacterium]
MAKTEVEVLEEHLEKLIEARDNLRIANKITDNTVKELVDISGEIRKTVDLLYGLAKL